MKGFFDRCGRNLGNITVFVSDCVGCVRGVNWLFDYDSGDIDLGIFGRGDKHLLFFTERGWSMEN